MTQIGATILDAEGLSLTADEKAFFREANPFGFILFARNIDHPDQVRALCGELREAVGRTCMITIDQEGGRVQRLCAPHWRMWDPPLDFATRAAGHALRAMHLRYQIIGRELRDLGLDSNCAPLIDVAQPDTHPFLYNRCYGLDAQHVARLGRAAAAGMLAEGVLPIIKHIPGHGRARQDSHMSLPTVDAPPEELIAQDFAPFRALNDMPMAMSAHVLYAQLDQRPATLSPVIIEMIRREIGFDGLLMSDDIAMKALGDDLPANARAAIVAGCDVVLHCNGTLAERASVADAAGTLNGIAAQRAQRALAQRAPRKACVDIAALEAELAACLSSAQ